MCVCVCVGGVLNVSQCGSVFVSELCLYLCFSVCIQVVVYLFIYRQTTEQSYIYVYIGGGRLGEEGGRVRTEAG